MLQNGVLSALPFIVQFVAIWTASIGKEQILKRTKVNSMHLARVSNTIGAVGSALSLIGVAFVDCTDRAWGVFGMVMAFASIGFYTPGMITSLVTIAPAFAGVIIVIVRIVSSLSAVGGSYLIALIIGDNVRRYLLTKFALGIGNRVAHCVLHYVVRAHHRRCAFSAVGISRDSTMGNAAEEIAGKASR